MSAGVDEAFEALRLMALEFVDPSAPSGDLYGVLMEVGLDAGVATLVALGDGTVSLYLSGGGGFLGAGEHPQVTESAYRFATVAMQSLEVLPVTSDISLAQADETKFFVLIDGIRRSASAPSDSLGHGLHKLSKLFRAGHALLHDVRRIHPDSRQA